jgi:riboflavin transporter FmnP
VKVLRGLAQQFTRCEPTTLLAFGVGLSLFDFATLYMAAATEGVLHIRRGIGLLQNLGLLSTLFGNALTLYVARKYYDAALSIRRSKALIGGSSTGVERTLAALASMVKMRGRHQFLIYGFITVGITAWLSNVSGHIFDIPEVRWGHKVFDSIDHPLTFFASRLHNIYTWIILAPFLGHVVVFTSLQLRRAIAVASAESALVYDVLNPDQRGGFGFIDRANVIFNIVTAVAYIEVTMHIETFAKMHAEHVVAYVFLTVTLILTNQMFLGSMYATIRMLRAESLNRLKERVYNESKLSFEILKYCYERRLSTISVLNGAIKATAIIVPVAVKLWT